MKMSDFDYKKYSLEKLEEWVCDAISGDATPQEIYNIIKGAVEEHYHYFKLHTGRSYELLCLLNGNGKGHIPAYDEYVKKKQNLVCDKDNPSPECQNSWNNFWEEHYYPEEYKGSTVSSVPPYYNSVMPSSTQRDIDRVKKWVLPTEVDGLTGDVFVNFPDDLLEAAGLVEGDKIEWVDQGDGSYLLKKVEKAPSNQNKSITELSYEDAVKNGWEMTDDGFWIPPEKN